MKVQKAVKNSGKRKNVVLKIPSSFHFHLTQGTKRCFVILVFTRQFTREPVLSTHIYRKKMFLRGNDTVGKI